MGEANRPRAISPATSAVEALGAGPDRPATAELRALTGDQLTILRRRVEQTEGLDVILSRADVLRLFATIERLDRLAFPRSPLLDPNATFGNLPDGWRVLWCPFCLYSVTWTEADWATYDEAEWDALRREASEHGCSVAHG